MTSIPHPSVHRKWTKHKVKKLLIAYSFILPNFIGFLFLVLLPSLCAIFMSLCNWTGAGFKAFVGLRNYEIMLRNSNFKIAFGHSMQYAIVTVPLTLIIALLIAMLLNRPIKGVGVFRAIYFWPYVTAVVALAAVWSMLFNPNMGLVNAFLSSIGIPKENLPRWMASTIWALPTIMLAQIWKGSGYYMVIFLAGLQGIPRELYEAARVDGANGWNCFWNVTLPMLSPTIFFVLIMLTIGAFQVYEIIEVMTKGGPGRASMVLSMHIYDSAFVDNKFGYACAVSMVLFAIVGAITFIQFRMEKKWVNY